MAKVRGPLLSLGAEGQIAHSIVFAGWKGIPYARQYVTPANPNTTSQQLTRNVFRALDAQYKYMGALAQAPWIAAAKGRPLVPRNVLMSANIPVLIGETDLAKFVFSPGNGGGIAPQQVTVVGGAGAGEIDVTINAPTTPVGWTLSKIVAAATLDRDPTVSPTTMMVEGSDTTSGATINLSGLTTTSTYAVAGWLEWARADGLTVYGHSQTFLQAAT